MADIFISYKRADRDRVEPMAELLREEKLEVWFDARLEVGRGEGFDAEIDREVTSAACVVVCWTREALNSYYVKAEAKKGLEQDVLVPVFLETVSLPVPFNGVDTADLSRWSGAADAPEWKRVLAIIKHKVSKSKEDAAHKRARSTAAYERITDKIYPGTLALLSQRIAAIRERDAEEYQADIEAIFSWLRAIAAKEARHTAYGYELADRQSGGDAWRWWDSGGAAERGAQIARVRCLLASVDSDLARSQELLSRPAP
jgi:hypothetical protein